MERPQLRRNEKTTKRAPKKLKISTKYLQTRYLLLVLRLHLLRCPTILNPPNRVVFLSTCQQILNWENYHTKVMQYVTVRDNNAYMTLTDISVVVS